MHLVQQIAQEITRILLLVVGVVVKKEWLENGFRVDDPAREMTFRVELILLVEVLADVDHFTEET